MQMIDNASVKIKNKAIRKRVNRSIFGTVFLAVVLAVFGTFMALPMVYIISNAL